MFASMLDNLGTKTMKKQKSHAMPQDLGGECGELLHITFPLPSAHSSLS